MVLRFLCDRKKLKYCICLVLAAMLTLHLHLEYFCFEVDCMLQRHQSQHEMVAAAPAMALVAREPNYRTRWLQFKRSNKNESYHVAREESITSSALTLCLPAADILEENSQGMLMHKNFTADPLGTSYTFDIDGERDVFVFLHMQKTGGTTFGKHLIHDMQMSRPCLCHHGRNKCECKNGRDLVWLVSRYSTGWRCGLHADWTELTACVDGMLDKIESATRDRRYLYLTLLRNPFSRYLSEYKHVSRGATWDSTKLQCDGRQASLDEVPPCFTGKNWKGVTLDSFMDCPYNLANNRQSRMLANLSLTGCYGHYSRLNHSQQCTMLQSAKDNLRKMAFFGLTEYQKETQYLFERTFGLKFTSDFFQYNHTHSSEVTLTNSQRNTLKRINSLDFQLYRFAKELFFQRLSRLKYADAHQSTIGSSVKLPEDPSVHVLHRMIS